MVSLYRFSASLKSNLNTYVHPIVILDTLENIHQGVSTQKAMDVASEKYQRIFKYFKLETSFVT